MSILINRVQFPVKSLGPGNRLAVWFQGCSIRCNGCISLDTWGADQRKNTSIEEIMRTCEKISGDDVFGVTLSGGEPFDQPDALEQLLTQLCRWRDDIGREIDILCYTGFSLSSVKARYPVVISMIDAIVSEPYECDKPTVLDLRGSANQRLTPLTPLGEERYGELIDFQCDRPSIDIQVTTDTIWFAGIPRRGDMAMLQKAAAKRGINMRKCSWRA